MFYFLSCTMWSTILFLLLESENNFLFCINNQTGITTKSESTMDKEYYISFYNFKIWNTQFIVFKITQNQVVLHSASVSLIVID